MLSRRDCNDLFMLQLRIQLTLQVFESPDTVSCAKRVCDRSLLQHELCNLSVTI